MFETLCGALLNLKIDKQINSQQKHKNEDIKAKNPSKSLKNTKTKKAKTQVFKKNKRVRVKSTEMQYIGSTELKNNLLTRAALLDERATRVVLDLETRSTKEINLLTVSKSLFSSIHFSEE